MSQNLEVKFTVTSEQSVRSAQEQQNDGEKYLQ